MSWLAILGISSGILSAICYMPYVRDIFKGTTKPERATWLIWSILTSILFFAQLAEGATHSLWLTGVQTLGVVVIFCLSIKYGVGGLQGRDVAALTAAGIGLIAWYLTQDANVALAITIIIDFSGAILTLLKAYKEPETETELTWLLSSVAGVLGALAVGAWSLSLLAFPVYVIVINFAVFLAIRLGKRQTLKLA